MNWPKLGMRLWWLLAGWRANGAVLGRFYMHYPAYARASACSSIKTGLTKATTLTSGCILRLWRGRHLQLPRTLHMGMPSIAFHSARPTNDRKDFQVKISNPSDVLLIFMSNNLGGNSLLQRRHDTLKRNVHCYYLLLTPQFKCWSLTSFSPLQSYSARPRCLWKHMTVVLTAWTFNYPSRPNLKFHWVVLNPFKVQFRQVGSPVHSL